MRESNFPQGYRRGAKSLPLTGRNPMTPQFAPPDHFKNPFPSSEESEKGVVAAMMLEPRAVAAMLVTKGVTKDYFYFHATRTVAEAIIALLNQHVEPEFISLTTYLRDHGLLEAIGGPPFINELNVLLPSAAYVSHHIDDLINKYTLRHTIQECDRLKARCYNEPSEVGEIITDVQRFCVNVGAIGTKAATVTIADHCTNYRTKRTERLAKPQGGIPGLSTHIPDLDGIIGGLCAPDLIVIGGTRDGGKSNSSGKTCFACDLAREVSFHHHEPTLFFSLEMSAGQLLQRIISAESGIPLSWITASKPFDEACEKLHEETIARIEASKLTIDDHSRTLDVVAAKCRAWRAQHPKGGAIFVDYLQLLMHGGRKRERDRTDESRLSEISWMLKGLAKELCVPVIALIQVNKEGRARGSEAIENDADVLMVIEHTEQDVVLRIDKARNGNNRTNDGDQRRIAVTFDRARVRFLKDA
jgi:replicative DNA helicase